jgi:hypothetical protein
MSDSSTFTSVTPYLRYPDGDAAAEWLTRVRTAQLPPQRSLGLPVVFLAGRRGLPARLRHTGESSPGTSDQSRGRQSAGGT